MGSQTPANNLPLVDFTKEDLKPGSESWVLASKNVQAALEEYGAFIAMFDKVQPQLRDRVLLATKEMFDLPEEKKKQNVSKHLHFGYLGKEIFPNRLHFESLGIEKITNLEDVQYFTNRLWPSGNNNFCETMHACGKAISELEQIVTKMMFERYGVEKNYESHKEETEYLLRFIRYEALGKDEKVGPDQIHGVPPHTDRSLITILHQNDIGLNPLQIVTKDGHCISAQIPSNSFLVMAGDAFEGWSNGRVTAGKHRVQMGGDRTRYSVALFSHSTGIIKVPEELVDEEHPLQFKSFKNFGLLRFSLTKEGRQAKNVLRAYCAV